MINICKKTSGNYIKIINPSTRKTNPYNVVGEICINTKGLMMGYLNNESETNDALQIHDDGHVWLHSGDLGYMDEDGFIFCKGRLKRMIITSGYNVYPSHIEEVIEKSKERIAENGSPKVLFLRASATNIRAKNSQDNVLGEMLKSLGCQNIADDEESLLENISLEYILQEDPEFIFFVQVGDDKDAIKSHIESFMKDNPIWQELTAVKTGRVYHMDKMLYNLKPNDRWGEAYEKLPELLAEGQK